MDHYRTVQTPIAFHRPGESLTRSRCFITYTMDYGMIEHSPTTDPHRWAVDEYEFSDNFLGQVIFLKWCCVRCGETHHEEWADEFPETFELLPRTIVNWDGSPPVGAWEASNTGSEPSDG